MFVSAARLCNAGLRRAAGHRLLSTNAEKLRATSSSLAFGSALLGGAALCAVVANNGESSTAETFGSGGAPPKITGKLPVIPLEKFRDAPPGRVWVSLQGGVYDVTDFLDAHPGGPYRIMMVAGQDLKAYWGVYHEIHDRPHIRELMEDYRIGNLSPADTKIIEAESTFSDAYLNEPERPRHKEMRVPSTRPWNMETAPRNLTASFFTPNELFFVRNHNPVPIVDEDEWVLELEGHKNSGMKGLKLSLADIKTKFPRTEVVSALQCAGNRQEDFVTPDRPLYVAPHWRQGAIGCARWAGVKVRDILKAAGLEVDKMALGQVVHSDMKIVNFIAEDEDETGTPYAGVIPVEKVIDPFGDAILAYDMNGETLPRDHGFPVRLLAPGHAGCRNVKWIKTIMVSEAPSELDSGSKLDRHFAPDMTFKGHIRQGEDMLRLDQGPVIQTLPVQSCISEPPNRATISGQMDHVVVEGVAWSGGGRGVCRVEVSIDGGKNFTAAELYSGPTGIPRTEAEKAACPAQRPNPTSKHAMESTPQSGMGKHWGWQQFREEVPLPADVKAKLARGEKVKLEVVSKAVDGDFNSQPEEMRSTWNVLGICSNHWAKVEVTVDPNKTVDSFVPAPKQPAGGSYVWPIESPGFEYKVKNHCGPKDFKNVGDA